MHSLLWRAQVAVQDGTLQLSMAPQNVVTGLRVAVPEELREGCAAGGAGGRAGRHGWAGGRSKEHVAHCSSCSHFLTPQGDCVGGAGRLCLHGQQQEGEKLAGVLEGLDFASWLLRSILRQYLHVLMRRFSPPLCAAELHVAVETEDGEPLPPDVAAAGLSLKLTPPGALDVTLGMGLPAVPLRCILCAQHLPS